MAIHCLSDAHGRSYGVYHGDCIDIMRQFPEASFDFAVYSPPFSGLYIYNDSIADMGNSSTDEEFLSHYAFFCRELHRTMRPGRLVAVHCKDLVFYKTQRGTAGLRDFPGMLVREHEAAGFNFHSRVTIWRCPVREMTKTKAHGLLYKQLRADASYSRQGLAEYLLVFRKWGGEEDPCEPVTHTHESFPLDQWQKWASPVWTDTRETDVLNSERGPNDEKHICPMPLDLTKRAVTLWSNPGDTVLSPFMGIGSEGVASLELGRRFVGVELKREYFEQAVQHRGTSHKEYVGRTTYMRKLAGEIITGEPMNSYTNAAMDRGTANEDEARNLYAFLRDVEPAQVGFIRNGNCGGSPDSLLGDDGGLEIKDAEPHIQIARLVDGGLPPEHKAQVQGLLMVSERSWWEFMSHSRGLPPLIVRVERDEAYIQELRAAVDQFVAELTQLVAWIGAM